MRLTANILAGIIIVFLSFYLGTYIEYSSPIFESFTISWEAVSAIATIAIPFVLYFLGQQEQQRKEKELQQEKEFKELKEYILNNILPAAKKLKELHNTQQTIRKRDIELVTIPMYNLKKYAFYTLYYRQIKIFANIIIHIIELAPYLDNSGALYLIAQWFENLEKMLWSKSFYESELEEILEYENTLLFLYNIDMEKKGVDYRETSMLNQDLLMNELNSEGKTIY